MSFQVLRKYSVANKNRRTVIPADCPYMVKLYKYFETDCSIFLILEHATGGKLWTYASAYLHHDLTNKVPFVCSLERSIGSRGSKRSRTSSSISGLEERVRRISGGEDNVFEDESPRKVVSKSSSRIERVPEDVGAQTEELDGAIGAGLTEPKLESDSIDESTTFQPENNSTPHKKPVGLDDFKADLATPPGLSESPEVASSYANIFNVAKKPQAPTDNSSEDFIHIEDMEETGSNLNDLVQVSSQYGDVTADNSFGSGLGDQSLVSPYNDSVYTSSDLSSHNKSFNSTVQQVNTKPPPITLFSIDSSDSPEVQSSDSLDRPAFRYSPDNTDLCGSLEGLGQLQEEVENEESLLEPKNPPSTMWQDHNPDSVMAEAMKAMHEMEQDDTQDKPDIISHSPPDTSGFGAYEDSSLSIPGMDLSEFFDNSGGNDRPRTVSSPAHSSHGGQASFDNLDYGSSKRSASMGGTDQNNTATSLFPFGQKTSSTSSFGQRNSFGSSEPKSSLDDLLQPSDTNDIESEWEKSAKTPTSVDTSGFLNKTDNTDTFSQDNWNNGANTSDREQNIETTLDSNGGTLTPGAVSGNESLESSTTPKELPSSIYSSTQSTPKHSIAIANSKMADWPGDVQSDIHAQLKGTRQYGESGIAPSALDAASDDKKQTENGRKSQLPETRLPSLSTFLAQMDEATAKHANQTTLPESCVRMWAAEIVIALSNLHSVGIICKDLRPHNILLAEGGHIRLTYFSQWKCVEPELSSYACDHFYTAPEVKGVYDVTEVCDWWSLGAILFELLTSKVSFCISLSLSLSLFLAFIKSWCVTICIY